MARHISRPSRSRLQLHGTRAPQRDAGFTLVEVMIAMAVLLVGSLGMLSLHRYGLQMTADARIVTRATAIAQDLLNQMQTWDYVNDARLANANTANDEDFADGAGAFERAITSADYDHADDELESSPRGWLGVPTAEVRQLGFTRYWNIAEPDLSSNGAVIGRRVAVIVRWERNGVGRRIVLVSFLRDPQVTN
jgi:type IV pilus modification protein PilV